MSRPKQVGLSALRGASRAHLLDRHTGRVSPNGNGHVSEQALERAWRDVQLHWLAEYPLYRELLRERVSEAARKAEALSQRIDKAHADVDYIGRSIDGCG